MNNYNDMDLNCLLNKWNLSHLYDRLKEQGITVDVLKMLKVHHIQKLLYDFSIGDQAKFEFHLDQWILDNKSIVNKPRTDQANFNFSSKSAEFSVMDILNNTYNGKEILNFYRKNETLYEEQRNLLINTITKYIEASGFECSLSNCVAMEKEICTIFPSEELDLYTNGKRGKIYNKLAHLKRTSKDILKKESNLQSESFIEECEEDYNLYLQHLKSESITAEEFDLYWRKCATFRFKQISESKSTAHIFKLWPDYIKPSGFQLINIDFTLKYPMAKSIHERWSQYEDKILLLLKTKITNATISKQLQGIDYTDKESKIFIIFWYLHNLLPPQQTIFEEPCGTKIRKKYSIADSQEGFALLAATNEELDAKLNLLKLQCRNIQPRLLIVGELNNIRSIFVYIDEVKYPFLTFLDAFDILFKIFFLLNLQYPEESNMYYNFIQSFFYDLPTSKKYTRISTIKHEILQLKL